MKTNKKSISNLPSIIFLICLLALTMLYFAFVYPKLSDKLAQINAEVQVAQDKVTMLLPYKPKLSQLKETVEEKKHEFEANEDLHLPVLFSNIIYSAADDAGIIVENLSIAENAPVEIKGGFEARSFTATLSLTMNNGEPSNQFIKAIESNEGCAMFITSMTYTKSHTAIPVQDEEAPPENAVSNDRVSLTINLLTVEKE